MPGFKSTLQAGSKLFNDRGVYQAIGTPSLRAAARGQTLTAEQLTKRGRRRVIGGGLGMGAMLGMNSMTAPRSSGGRGYTYPRSSGGYA